MTHIGIKIKELRKKKDMTQEKLAEYLNVSFQAVSKWETGAASPDLSMIVPLARLLGVSIDELFGLVSTKEDPRLKELESALNETHEQEIQVSVMRLPKPPWQNIRGILIVFCGWLWQRNPMLSTTVNVIPKSNRSISRWLSNSTRPFLRTVRMLTPRTVPFSGWFGICPISGANPTLFFMPNSTLMTGTNY